MNYCILRTKKLSAFGSIAGSAKHTFREIPTPNADASRTHLNWTSGAKTSASLCAAVSAVLPRKRRKDAVLCIEYLITASPEWFQSTSEKAGLNYFNGAIRWLRERHGAENVVCLNLQRDEKCPHLVAYVVPKTKDGRLSAKDFLGGRSKLSAMQSDFWRTVGREAGLERGLEGSTTKHTTAKQYSAALTRNPGLERPTPPVPTLADRATGRAKKMDEAYRAEVAAYEKLVEQARSEALLGKRARQRQAVALALLRANLDNMQAYKVEAARLVSENRKLREHLRQQKKYFVEQLAAMKALLDDAVARAGRLLTEVGLWKGRAETAQVEMDGLRKLLNSEPRASMRPSPHRRD